MLHGLPRSRVIEPKIHQWFFFCVCVSCPFYIFNWQYLIATYNTNNTDNTYYASNTNNAYNADTKQYLQYLHYLQYWQYSRYFLNFIYNYIRVQL